MISHISHMVFDYFPEKEHLLWNSKPSQQNSEPWHWWLRLHRDKTETETSVFLHLSFVISQAAGFLWVISLFQLICHQHEKINIPQSKAGNLVYLRIRNWFKNIVQGNNSDQKFQKKTFLPDQELSSTNLSYFPWITVTVCVLTLINSTLENYFVERCPGKSHSYCFNEGHLTDDCTCVCPADYTGSKCEEFRKYTNHLILDVSVVILIWWTLIVILLTPVLVSWCLSAVIAIFVAVITRKSSCVNARGIPTTAYEVLYMLFYPGGEGVGTLDGRGV